MKKLLSSFILSISCCFAAFSADINELKMAIQQIQQAMVWIDQMYVDSIDRQKVAADAIRGMLKELDPHSNYLTPDEVKELNQDLGGNFEGIGVRYQMINDTLVVMSTITGGPSEKAGVMAGDQIVVVSDTTIAGVKMSNKEIQRRLRGPKGSKVDILIRRSGESEYIPFQLVRDKIPVLSVDAVYMVDDHTGYIKISRFAKTTFEEMENAIDSLRAKGMKHLILDLQNNGGGYLETAVQMAGKFLAKNELVVYTKGRNEQRMDYKTREKGSMQNGRLVVLIDEHSASASEILSGAMQDLDRGVIVGRRSFGKGLVQRPIPLIGGAMIRLTVSHYYTPSGRCIQKPYEKGQHESYRSDIDNRYKKGEFTSADSIHFADSLRYETRAGRTVYGGGGIMPDVFVPLDTTKTTPTHRNIIAKGTFNRFVTDHYLTHSKQLHNDYKALDDFIARFEVSDDMLHDLHQRAIADSVKIVDEELERSASILKLQIKASLASNLFEGEGGYYRIINDMNEIYRKGVEIISDEKEYQKLLKK